jgi:DNA invertase Pin-like site-specific DNA recombinase
VSKNPIQAAILVRVSDNEKETTRQIRELRKIARQRGWKVVEVCKEPTGPEPEERTQGADRVRELVEKGNVTKVMVDEMSPIGRRSAAALEFLQFLEQRKVSLYWHSQEIETLQANGKRSAKAVIVFTLLDEMARAEREAIVERTKIGLAAARARGRVGGRPKGLSPEAKRNAAKAAALYRKGTNKAQICKKLQISRSSLYRYLHYEGVNLGVDMKRTTISRQRKK